MLSRGKSLLTHPPTYTVPLLLQHGSADKVTSCAVSETFFKKLTSGNEDRELKIWEGYFHELHNEPVGEREKAIKYVSDWILVRARQVSPRAKL
jgi:acylglycerol lipase